MLKKENRFSKKEFDSFYNSQKTKISTPIFIVYYSFPETKTSKFAVVVSAKMDKRAVQRNRIRRLIYQSVFEIYKNIKRPINALIVVKKGINLKNLNFEIVKKELEKAFEKIDHH